MSTVWKINSAILFLVISVYGGLFFFQQQPAEKLQTTEESPTTNLQTSKRQTDLEDQFNGKSKMQFDEDPGLEGITLEDKERYRTINREISETSKQRDEVILQLNTKPDDPFLNRALEEVDTKLYFLQSEASFLDEKFRQPQTFEELTL